MNKAVVVLVPNGQPVRTPRFTDDVVARGEYAFRNGSVLLPEDACLIRLVARSYGTAAMQGLPADHRDTIIMWALAKLDVAAFVAASAVVTGAALFMLTLFLVVKGAPPGVPVGPHLGQLALFFPGYSVTATGAFIGGAYASVVGGIAGFLLAVFWNAAHALFLAVIRMRASLASYSID